MLLEYKYSSIVIWFFLTLFVAWVEKGFWISGSLSISSLPLVVAAIVTRNKINKINENGKKLDFLDKEISVYPVMLIGFLMTVIALATCLYLIIYVIKPERI